MPTGKDLPAMNTAYLTGRVLQMVPLLIGVSLLGFGMMQLAPGGFAAPYTLNAIFQA